MLTWGKNRPGNSAVHTHGLSPQKSVFSIFQHILQLAFVGFLDLFECGVSAVLSGILRFFDEISSSSSKMFRKSTQKKRELKSSSKKKVMHFSLRIPSFFLGGTSCRFQNPA
jgi:hypothetical protein